MDTLIQDVRYALGMFRKSLLATCTILATLAIGIGGVTALFSVVNAAILRPLPFPDADRLVAITESTPTGLGAVAYPNFVVWKQRAKSFEQLAAYSGSKYNVQLGDRTEHIDAELVTGEYLGVLGARTSLGRLITPAETNVGAHNAVALISYALWQGRFGSDPNVIGKLLKVNEVPFTVIGVLSPDFVPMSSTAQVFVPISMYDDLWPQVAQFHFLSNRDTHWHRVIGKLRTGVSVTQADAEMKAIADSLAQEYPAENKGRSAVVRSASDLLRGKVRTSLWLLFGSITFVLLIACANIANLMMTRMTSRRREIAIRLAIGANRQRLARQLYTEIALLAGAGGLGAIVFAVLVKNALWRMLPLRLPTFGVVVLDWRVLAVSFAATVLCCILVATAPIHAGRALQPIDALREGGHATGTKRSRKISAALASTQVALAVMLMCGAGLLIRTLWAMYNVDFGFRPDHVLFMRFQVPNKYQGDARRQFGERVREQVLSVPGVESAAVTMIDPFLFSGLQRGFTVQGREATRGDAAEIYYQETGTGYFRTMGVPLLEGRDFTATDDASHPPVMIVSRSFATHFWPGESPLGKHVKLGGDNAPWMTVVGMVGDYRFDSVTQTGDIPVYYAPLLQSEVIVDLDVVVRTRTEPGSMITPITNQIISFDRDVPVYNAATLDERVASQVASTRGVAMILGIFAAVALFIACIGVYGVIATGMAQRTKEMAVRLALGAQARDIMMLVVRAGAGIVLPGVIAGCVVAVAVLQLIRGLLFGVRAHDAATFASAVMLLVAAASLGVLIPARRVSRIEPSSALRNE
jgi:predicted permease